MQKVACTKHPDLPAAVRTSRYLLAALPEYGKPLGEARREEDDAHEEEGWDPKLGPEEPNLWFEAIAWSLKSHAAALPSETTAAIASIIDNLGTYADTDWPMAVRRFEALPAALTEIAATYLAALEKFEATHLRGDRESAGEPEHPMSCGWAEPRAAFGLRMDLVCMHTSTSGEVVDSWQIRGRDDAIAECMELARQNPGSEYRLCEELSGEMVFRTRMNPDTGLLFTYQNGLLE